MICPKFTGPILTEFSAIISNSTTADSTSGISPFLSSPVLKLPKFSGSIGTPSERIIPTSGNKGSRLNKLIPLQLKRGQILDL